MHLEQTIVKIADTPAEFDQIHQLNYQIFVEEIPQHTAQTNQSKRLIDKFHSENTYIIAILKEEVIGMTAYRAIRPFSLDLKLENLDQYLPNDFYPCECRLMAIKKEYRHSSVILELIEKFIEYAFDYGHNGILISAVTHQIGFYQNLGFVKFGPLLDAGSVQFQPMFIDLLHSKYHYHSNKKPMTLSNAYFLPGPVQSFKGVDEAYADPLVSHRSPQFMPLFFETQKLLAQFVNTKYVQIAMGGGTLANDIVAWQLRLLNQKGLILSNGEFGDRLIQQARRANLDFHVIKKEWGNTFSVEEIIATLTECSDIHWLWGVHCETSTGMLNDIHAWMNISRTFQIKLALDCVSSLGTVPLNLSQVYLASGSSAKGLGAKPGLSFVFYNHPVKEQPDKLPTILDLGLYAIKHGIPFTLSSSLLKAVFAALSWFNHPFIWFRSKQLATIIRQRLKAEDVTLIVEDSMSSPAIITVKLDKKLDSTLVGNELEKKGIFTYYQNDYLQKNNWLQIALMGRLFYKDIMHLLNHVSLFKCVNERKNQGVTA